VLFRLEREKAKTQYKKDNVIQKNIKFTPPYIYILSNYRTLSK